MTIQLTLEGIDRTFEIIRRQHQKRIIVRPLKNNIYQVSAPKSIHTQTIKKTLENNASMILSLTPAVSCDEELQKSQPIPLFGDVWNAIPEIDVNGASSRSTQAVSAIKKQLIATLREAVMDLVEKSNPHFSIDLTTVRFRFRYMKSKFGSCQPDKKRITLNLELVHYPKAYLQFIFNHEIIHLTHPNHSKTFYQALSKLCPNHDSLRQKLNALRKVLLKDGFSGLINVTNPQDLL